MVDDLTWQLEEQSTKRITEYQETELLALYAGRSLKFKTDRFADGVQACKVSRCHSPITEAAKNRYAYAKATEGLPATATPWPHPVPATQEDGHDHPAASIAPHQHSAD